MSHFATNGDIFFAVVLPWPQAPKFPVLPGMSGGIEIDPVAPVGNAWHGYGFTSRTDAEKYCATLIAQDGTVSNDMQWYVRVVRLAGDLVETMPHWLSK